MEGHLMQRGKSKTWYLVYDTPASDDRKRSQQWTRIGKMSKTEAQERKRELLRHLDNGEWIEDRNQTVAALLKTWLADNEHRIAGKTWEYYDMRIRLNLIPTLGSVSLSKLTPKHIVDAYAKIRAESSDKMCVHAHRVLRAAMNYGRKTLRVVKENIMENVPSPKAEHKELTPLSEEQVRGIIGAARGTRLEVPILVAALTGLRRGELLALRWKSIDFERGSLTVSESLEQTRRYGLRFKTPKSRSSRRVLPVAPELLSILKEYRSKQVVQTPNDLVFSDGGSPWAPDTFSKQFAGIMRRVGITGFRLHDTRHAFASLTLSNGSSVKEVSALLGHASATLTLSTYAHVIAGMGREAVNGLAKSLLTGPGTPLANVSKYPSDNAVKTVLDLLTTPEFPDTMGTWENPPSPRRSLSSRSSSRTTRRAPSTSKPCAGRKASFARRAGIKAIRGV